MGPYYTVYAWLSVRKVETNGKKALRGLESMIDDGVLGFGMMDRRETILSVCEM